MSYMDIIFFGIGVNITLQLLSIIITVLSAWAHPIPEDKTITVKELLILEKIAALREHMRINHFSKFVWIIVAEALIPFAMIPSIFILKKYTYVTKGFICGALNEVLGYSYFVKPNTDLVQELERYKNDNC